MATKDGARFPWMTIAGLLLGFVAMQLVALRGERDPLAALPQLGVVPPVPGSLAWPTPLLTPRKAGEERVFFVGASETVAMPYRPEGHYGYGYMLGAGLAAATGRKDLYIRAEGGIALDSPQLVEQASKLLQYGDPSAIVLVVGGNEFLNRLPLGGSMRADGLLGRVGDFGAATRELCEDGVAWLRGRPELASVFERFPADGGGGDVRGFVALTREARPGVPALRGLPIGVRDRELMLGRMAESARTLAQRCEEKGVRFALALAPHGYDVQPPWCSRVRGAARSAQDSAIDALLDAVFRAELAGIDATKLAQVDAWITSFPDRADLRHARARMLRKLGRIEDARTAYENALDLDAAPLHRVRAVRARLLALGKELGVPLLLLEEGMRAEDGLVDPALFLDYAHPTLAGHARIARWLAREHMAFLAPALQGAPKDDGIGESKAWWTRFEAGGQALAKTVDAASVRRAPAVMLSTVASYYLCFGNFRDALEPLEIAVRVYGEEDSDEARRARDSLAFCRAQLAESRGR